MCFEHSTRLHAWDKTWLKSIHWFLHWFAIKCVLTFIYISITHTVSLWWYHTNRYCFVYLYWAHSWNIHSAGKLTCGPHYHSNFRNANWSQQFSHLQFKQQNQFEVWFRATLMDERRSDIFSSPFTRSICWCWTMPVGSEIIRRVADLHKAGKAY